MKSTKKAAATIAIASVLAVAACSDDALDSTVIFEHEPIMAQPWTASGELVDAGLICPSGDRQNTNLMHPDGTSWTLEDNYAAIKAAEGAGGSHWDVPRKGWEEYVCDDGSGTFTLLEEVTEGSPGQFTGELISGTGAYTDLTGSCVVDLTENEDYTEILGMVGTCEFDIGSTE